MKAEATAATTAGKGLAAIQSAVGDGRSALSEPEAKLFLAELGFRVPQGHVAPSPQTAAAAAQQMGCPVMVKWAAGALLHKSDVGAVRGPLQGAKDVETTCLDMIDALRQRDLDVEEPKFLVEAYEPCALECILALRFDPAFGPLVLFGLGGLLTEAFAGTAIRLAPLRESDITDLLRESGVERLLATLKARSRLAGEDVRRSIAQLARLAEVPEVRRHVDEIEINPLGIHLGECRVLDAVVTLKSVRE